MESAAEVPRKPPRQAETKWARAGVDSGSVPPASASVDIEAYVVLHTNRYSVPLDWIGRRVEVRKTKDKIEIQLDARAAGDPPPHCRSRAPARDAGRASAATRPAGAPPRPDPHPEENAILIAAPDLAEYVTALKQRSRKVITLALRQLLRFVREYPRDPQLAAVGEAARYGLYDLDRLERMILRRVTREYFLLNHEGPREDE